MATELQTKTETKVDRGIFADTTNFSIKTEFKRPAFKEIDFDDVTEYTEPTTVQTVEKHAAMPQIQQKPAQQEVASQDTNKKAKLNAHGKIILSVVAVVICALMAFAIGNAVTLSNLGGAVASKQKYVAAQQQTVNDLQQQYNAINNSVPDAASDKFGYVDASEADNVVNVQPVETLSRPTSSIEGNWFDNLCNFFSGLFN